MNPQIAAITQAARQLREAAATGTPCAPVRDLIGATDVAAAYAVQEQLTHARLADGARVVGRKIGLTNPAVQRQLGVEQPDFGFLFDDMDYSRRPIPAGLLLQPKVEAELAFVLGEDLAEGALDEEQLRGAIEATFVALEIVDSRIAGWDISYGDTVADNASAGLYVLGTELPGYVEPALVTMVMSLNGATVSTGRGADCLGDPLNALGWLARTARELGEPLRAGQVILSGALGPMAAVAPGDQVEAVISFGGTVVGNVSSTFEEA